MRLIDAEALKKHIITPRANGKDLITELIDSMPTIDAMPVVRCKDCKYYEEQDETIGTCLLTESGAHIKGYCSWAEVKEE